MTRKLGNYSDSMDTTASLAREAMFTTWPDPASVKFVRHDGMEFYSTPQGEFPRTTNVTKLLGTGTEGLIKWSANTEHSAVIEALSEVLRSAPPAGPSGAGEIIISQNIGIVAAVEARLGPARAHQRALAKAGDIGTAIHKCIQWYLGGQKGARPPLSQSAGIGYMSWLAWWTQANLIPVRVEQPVWDAEIGYAGTIDLIASTADGQLIVCDWKSASGIYDTHHLQLAAYVHAARQWEPNLMPGPIVHIPKSAEGNLEVTPHELGHLYDGRVLSFDELLEDFKCCRKLWNSFVGPRP